MAFAEDQHPVGDLGPGGEHEPLRVGIRLRASRRDLDYFYACVGQDRVERHTKLSGPVTDQEPEQVARSPRSISRLRTCCAVHRPSGLAVTPRMCTDREPTSITNKQYRRWRVTAQPTWKKSVASIAEAWVCRNFRHVMSERRSGAGGVFSALRTLRIVDAPTRWPSLSSSPWIRWYPQPLFSVASCSMRAAIPALTGDRPVRLGQIHLRVTRRRCQRRTVPGGGQPVRSQPWRQEPDQRGEDCAVGPVEPGPGTGTAQHGDLVPQHEQLGVLGG